MDFSTGRRSLESLQRRKPSVPQVILDVTKKLLDDNDHSWEESAILQLMVTSNEKQERWEALAVGLNLSCLLLERATEFAVGVNKDNEEAAGAVVGSYPEGPRVPAITSISSKETTTNSVDADPAATTSEGAGEQQQYPSSWFCGELLKLCHRHLEHSEPRVRTLVSKCVGRHARFSIVGGRDEEDMTTLTQQRRDMYDSILQSLDMHLRLGRDNEQNYSKETDASTTPTDENNNNNNNNNSNNSSTGYSRDSSGAMDDTTGWRALETDVQAVASVIDGCGMQFITDAFLVKDDFENKTKKLLLALRQCCIEHVNRHVRAAALAALDRMVHAASLCSADILMDVSSSPNLLQVVLDCLKVSLADNWSQVRMASSVLCRTFLLALLKQQQPESTDIPTSIQDLYPILLPRMCLNRFYLAQGVKLYSHETWRLVFANGGGMEAVAQTAGAICRYYVKMCDADNHVVREAACQAVAELAQKIGSHPQYSEYLAPFVPLLLQALLMCFHDESWPVRDEACLACGTFCRAYPEECLPELPTLRERWTDQLTDPIWSVREDAAVALGDALEAYPKSLYVPLLDILRTGLPKARTEQPAMTMEEYKRRQNDVNEHVDGQLYSCGSLAPKLRKNRFATEDGNGRKSGAARLGCTSCSVDRPKAPWEETDGCIYLLREICIRCCKPAGADDGSVLLEMSDETLLPFMTDLADVCRVRHFPQADDLRSTLWKQLPAMAHALGKKRFKRTYLELFLDLLFWNLRQDGNTTNGASRLSVHAAGQCMEELSTLVGPSIFRGRLEEEWQRNTYDRMMEERRMMQQQQQRFGGSDSFSPFGPMGGAIVPQPANGHGGFSMSLENGPARAGSRQNYSGPPRDVVPGSGFEDTL